MAHPIKPVPDHVAAYLHEWYATGNTKALARVLRCSEAKVRADAKKLGIEKAQNYGQLSNLRRSETLKGRARPVPASGNVITHRIR